MNGIMACDYNFVPSLILLTVELSNDSIDYKEVFFREFRSLR